MIVQINIDIENARKTLEVCACSLEEYQMVRSMTDTEIKDLVLQHCKCWGISEIQ